jgi:predicted enzyme related to lactoylglutathione lyase
MAGVRGIGGVFLRAQDADALRLWYADVLGIEINGENGAAFQDYSPESVVAFSIFAKDSSYIGDPSRQMAMINFIVDDLEELVIELEARGVSAEPIQAESYGKFTWITDPESNRIEMWEPTPS